MKYLHPKHHWIGRLLASDPGQIRFQKAGKATISLITSVFTTMFILHLLGITLLAAAIVSGIVGLMGIMLVMDDTRNKKKVTTVLMGGAAATGVTAGTLLSGNSYYVDLMMLAIIFSSFYFSQFQSRYFSLGMLCFISVYISSVLKIPQDQLPLFYLGILVGVVSAFLYNFMLFQGSAQTLKRSMQSFHIQANLTFNLLIKGIQDPELNQKRIKSLDLNVQKLRKYARTVAANLNSEDIDRIWPGLDPSRMRLYVFDTGMLIETLAESIQGLKKADALESNELTNLLIWIMKSLRDTAVLAEDYTEQNLREAELAVQALRNVITDLLHRTEHPKGWLFLIRRIESIANHIVEAGLTIQQSLSKGEIVRKEETNETDNGEKGYSEKEKGLKPSTKKAYQALVAGVLAIIVGQIISPANPYWVLLTAFICLLGTESVGRIYLKGFQRSAGTIIGAIIGFLLAKVISGHSTVELVLLFSVCFLAFYLVTISYTLMSVFITMMIAFMYNILLGGVSFSLIGARVMDTIAGALIALGVAMIIFPKKTKNKVADVTDDYLAELKPFITNYVRRFRKDISIHELTDLAIDIDEKLQAIEDEARPLLKRSETHSSSSDISRWITVFTAINYYARHLVASAYRKHFEYPAELEGVFKQVEKKLAHNIDTLSELIKGNVHAGAVYKLDVEREQIERLAPSINQSHQDLVHHLYYVWRINQSIVTFGSDFGAQIRDKNGKLI